MPATHTFFGGLQLQHHKTMAFSGPVKPLPLPDVLHVPLLGHRYQPDETLLDSVAVVVGQSVQANDVLVHAFEDYQPAVHAPYAGKVVHIGPRAFGRDKPLAVISLILDQGQHEKSLPADAHLDAELPSWDAEALLDHLAQCGIVGLGGAQFPTAEKMRQAQGRVHTLILNGVECEPYIACDEALMRLRPNAIAQGGRLLAQVLGARRLILAVEDPLKASHGSVLDGFDRAKQEMSSQGKFSFDTVTVEPIYPQGAERQLIKTLIGQEVPAEGLPIDLGVVTCNVATAAAVFDASMHHQPLTHRIVSVTGPGIRAPLNVYAPIGAPMSALIALAGGVTEDATRLIFGGPLSGQAIVDDQRPIHKGALCVLALTDDYRAQQRVMPCIQCGFCVDVCPSRLMPQLLYQLASQDQHHKANAYGLMDCIECGCCNAVCPSHLPLVEWYRFSKDQLRILQADEHKQVVAKRRHEARQKRLTEAARVKEERRKARQERLAEADAARSEIEAAIARAQSKKPSAS